MFSAIRNFFTKPDYTPPPHAGLDISEPIITFIETVKRDPNRFRVAYRHGLEYAIQNNKMHLLKMIDRKLKREIEFIFNSGPMYYEKTIYIGFATEDERKYLMQELYPIFKARKARYYNIVRQRAQRRIDRQRADQRQELMRLYCTDAKG